jgi:glycosyltransferase 2 family protein
MQRPGRAGYTTRHPRGFRLAQLIPSTRAPASIVRHPGVRLVLLLLAGVALVYALVGSWGELRATAWEFRPLPVVFACVCLLGVDILVAALWVLTCRSLGGRIALLRGVRIVLLSNLGKYVPGKIVHAVSQVVMASEQGVPASLGITSILVELALSLMGACFVSLFSLPVLVEAYRGVLLAIAALALPLGLIALHPSILRRLLVVAARIVPGAKGLELPQLAPYHVTLGLFVGYALSWVIMAVAQFAVAYSIYPIDIARLPAMGGVVAISYVFGLVVPFAPAGLGAREGVAILLLSSFMPLPAAVATSVLYRVVSITADALGAALFARR